MGQSDGGGRDRDVRAGLVCAEAFQRLSEPIINRIARDVTEGSYRSAPPEIGELVASAVNLSFALELYLKSLLAQLGEHARGHNLRKLYDALPSDVRGQIRERYDATWQSEWNGRHVSVTLAKGPPDPPVWEDYSDKPKDIAALLERSCDCFQSWRYVFEWTEPPGTRYQRHEFEYGLLLSACIAVRATLIAAFEGQV